jgi:FkbM family methyltransferase
MDDKRIYFDVGAHNGDVAIPLASDPNNVIYAFEPQPHLVEHIKQQTAGFPNYHIYQCAVSNYSGVAQFNVLGNWDYSSSLNQVRSDVKNAWPYDLDFSITSVIDVDVITLKDFIEQNHIDSIYHFYCDTQGSDLEVLMGMGEHLDKIVTGVVEMATSHDKKFYSDQKYLVDDAVKFLVEHNFDITSITYNDAFGNEVNVSFKKK